MRVVIVGAGMAGLVLARALLRRGTTPVVLERAPAGTPVPGPIMLPYQAYDALEDIGLMDEVRRRGRPIAPRPDGSTVAEAVGREELLGLLREGVDIRHGAEVVDLLRTGDRVTGVRVARGGVQETLGADLVAGADGTRSGVRSLAGIPARTSVADTAFVSFRSPVEAEDAFLIRFLSDGRQVTLLGWPGGSAGSWQIPRPPGGAAEALAPGLDAYRAAFTALLPQAAGPLAAVEGDGWFYREVIEVRCDRWWVPGVALVGEALHAMNPEAGIGSGLGMGDALALAVAVARNGDDPDAACRDYEHWRRPAVDPYLAVGSQGVRVVAGGPPRPEERWPPGGDA
jgi:2-polyprenyl-6-methoxyphenol hydroxylase-like FAD-dependent oxidoreductase